MVKTYSVKTQANLSLSANFKVREFASKDGADKVLIDTDLVTLLQRIRDHFAKPVTINSAYRTAAHNKAVGGASASKHLEGKAADIKISGVAVLEIARFAEKIGVLGIGCYESSGFVHVDTRTAKYFWNRVGSKDVSTSTFAAAAPTPAPPAPDNSKNPYQKPVSTLKKNAAGNGVRWIQWALNNAGYPLSVDGVFGEKTVSALKKFQTAKKLVSDGVAGPKTRRILDGGNPYPKPAGNIKKGSTGNGVRFVQWELYNAGYSLAIDGNFGAGTESAVRRFQSNNGLTSDGVAGPKTLAKLTA